MQNAIDNLIDIMYNIYTKFTKSIFAKKYSFVFEFYIPYKGDFI